MPHNWDYEIDSLRKQVASDVITFKLEKERLYALRDKDAGDLQLRDRNVIINWSRASIADYNEKLDDMEKVEKPSMEEKQIMQQLMELITLGDHIGDIQGLMEKRLDAKFGKVSWMLASEVPAGSYVRADGKMVVPRKRQTSGTTAPSAAGPREAVLPLSQPAPSLLMTLKDAPAPIKTEQPASKSLPTSSSPKIKPTSAAGNHPNGEQATDSNPAMKIDLGSTTANGNALSHSNLDTKGIYARLGLTPAASMDDIKKAARRMKLALHPDKNKNDPDAGVKFAEFIALYGATLENEESRDIYDKTTPDQLTALSRRESAVNGNGG